MLRNILCLIHIKIETLCKTFMALVLINSHCKWNTIMLFLDTMCTAMKWRKFQWKIQGDDKVDAWTELGGNPIHISGCETIYFFLLFYLSLEKLANSHFYTIWVEPIRHLRVSFRCSLALSKYHDFVFILRFYAFLTRVQCLPLARACTHVLSRVGSDVNISNVFHC